MIDLFSAKARNHILYILRSMADPGFPRVGRQPQNFGEPTYYFGQLFFLKPHENTEWSRACVVSTTREDEIDGLTNC